MGEREAASSRPRDVSTTMINTLVLRHGAREVRRALDTP